jgi:isoleucyl-tRNA synthetase
MEEVRKIVSLALEKRMAAGVKVRQPLRKLKAKSLELRERNEYTQLIKDEVNVKEVEFDEKLDGEMELDTEITEELQKEGNARELIRAIQDLRKQKGLKPQDAISLLVETDENGREFLNSVAEEIKKPTNISGIIFETNDGTELLIGEMKFKISIK